MPEYVTTRSGLIVPAAAFAEAVSAKPELQEIASIDRDWTKQFFGQVLRNDDDTLITRGGGKGLKIYDELERDAQAYCDLQKRKLAVVARPWEVVPATNPSDLDEKAAAQARELLGRIQFDRLCMELLDATLKGYAVGEVMWEVYSSAEHGALVAPSEIIARAQRRFTFDRLRDEKTREHALRLLTQGQMMEGVSLPERKFIVHRFGAKDGSPFGLGLGNRLFWPVFFKRQDIGFWLTFADKFGSPTAVGKYPKGAGASEQKKLLAMLRQIANDVGIIVPEGTVVELLEAARSGSIDTYEKLARYMDEQISKIVLGGTMTSTAQAAGLGSGQAEVHDAGRIEIARADSDLLSDTLNATLLRWITEFNVPGARPPRVYRNFEEEDIEQIDTMSQVIERLVKMGMKVPVQWAHDRLSIPAAQEGEEVLMAPAAPETVPPAGFSEAIDDQRSGLRASQDALLQAADAVAADYQRLLGTRVDDLVAMLEETGDLATFREQLAYQLSDGRGKTTEFHTPSPAVVEALARAGFSAQLLARTPAEKKVSLASFMARLRSLFSRPA